MNRNQSLTCGNEHEQGRRATVWSARSVLGRGSQRFLVARPYEKMTSLMA